ncbi:MAG: 50S ribosomal protein L11 methyltransferase [Chthoniobacterales bacterium]
MKPTTHLWTRLTSARWEDSWTERLRFAGPENLVTKAFPASRTLRLQVYTDETIGQKLLSSFGGSLRPFNMAAWTPPEPIRRNPLRIAGGLRLHNDRKIFLKDKNNPSSKKGFPLLIPAAMAFGTGEHATTNTCLRLLSNIVKTLPPEKWSLLDLGTGSGILALAGELLGAKKILGIDFDQRCVTTAKENAEANQLPRARFRHADILKWHPPGTWNVVTANLYSSVLTSAGSKIVASIADNSHLIISGILAVEEKDVLTFFKKLGLKKVSVITRGKWCAMHFQKDRTSS